METCPVHAAVKERGSPASRGFSKGALPFEVGFEFFFARHWQPSTRSAMDEPMQRTWMLIHMEIASSTFTRFKTPFR